MMNGRRVRKQVNLPSIFTRNLLDRIKDYEITKADVEKNSSKMALMFRRPGSNKK